MQTQFNTAKKYDYKFILTSKERKETPLVHGRSQRKTVGIYNTTVRYKNKAAGFIFNEENYSVKVK